MVGNSLNTTGVSAVKGSSNTVKLLCSYDGKILPRFPDGKLRYVGGETRVLAVDRSVPFSGLLTKLSELYGSPVSLRCQLPGEDLDALVSITSDEDLANLIEEYDRANRDESEKTLKLRAFLSTPRAKTPSPPGTAKSPAAVGSRFVRAAMTNRCVHHPPPPQSVRFQFRSDKSAADDRYHNSYVPGNPRNSNSNSYLVHNGNYWQ